VLSLVSKGTIFKRSARYKELSVFNDFWRKLGQSGHENADIIAKHAVEVSSPHPRHLALRAYSLSQESGAILACASGACGRYTQRHDHPDPTTSPHFWTCAMTEQADELLPPLWEPLKDFYALSEFTAGSLVLARGPNFPWWPAIVDICPDVESFLKVKNDVGDDDEGAKSYAVTYLRGQREEATRQWVSADKVVPFDSMAINQKRVKCGQRRYRLAKALKVAKDMRSLTCRERLRRESFLTTYKGNWKAPPEDQPPEIETKAESMDREVEEIVEVTADIKNEGDYYEADNRIAINVKNTSWDMEPSSNTSTSVPETSATSTPEPLIPMRSHSQHLESDECRLFSRGVIRVGHLWCKRRWTGERLWPPPPALAVDMVEAALINSSSLLIPSASVESFLQDAFPWLRHNDRRFCLRGTEEEGGGVLRKRGVQRASTRAAMRRPYSLDTFLTANSAESTEWSRPDLSIEEILIACVFAQFSSADQRSSDLCLLTLDDAATVAAFIFPFFKQKFRFFSEVRNHFHDIPSTGIVLPKPSKALCESIKAVNEAAAVTKVCVEELAESMKRAGPPGTGYSVKSRASSQSPIPQPSVISTRPMVPDARQISRPIPVQVVQAMPVSLGLVSQQAALPMKVAAPQPTVALSLQLPHTFSTHRLASPPSSTSSSSWSLSSFHPQIVSRQSEPALPPEATSFNEPELWDRKMSLEEYKMICGLVAFHFIEDKPNISKELAKFHWLSEAERVERECSASFNAISPLVLLFTWLKFERRRDGLHLKHCQIRRGYEPLFAHILRMTSMCKSNCLKDKTQFNSRLTDVLSADSSSYWSARMPTVPGVSTTYLRPPLPPHLLILLVNVIWREWKPEDDFLPLVEAAAILAHLFPHYQEHKSAATFAVRKGLASIYSHSFFTRFEWDSRNWTLPLKRKSRSRTGR